MRKLIIPTLAFALLFVSCKSEQTEKERLAREEQENQQRAKEERAETVRSKQVRAEQEEQAEAERIKQELYDKHISCSLPTGATPYSNYYGGNPSCSDYGCSQIKVMTSNSDVIVTIKKSNEVVRHAYIQAGDSYTFSFPDGIYQAFFYYGKGWNPTKEMKGGKLRGGFISDEYFGKDESQSLSNNILEYKLILQQNGNFSTKPSNAEEAL